MVVIDHLGLSHISTFSKYNSSSLWGPDKIDLDIKVITRDI